MVHGSLNAEGLDDLAPIIKPAAISSEIRQGQECLHLYVDLREHQVSVTAALVSCSPC